MDDLFILLLNGLLTISVLTLLAFIFNKLTKEQSIFKSISIVILALTTAYALILSSFTSYLLIIFIFLVYAIFRNIIFKNKKSSDFGCHKINVLKEGALILFYFLVSFFLLNIQSIIQDTLYINLHSDFSFYAGVSEILSRTGIENTTIDIALDGQKSFAFYHYFELWFNGLLSDLFSITHLKSLMYLTLPVLSTVMLRGLFELQQNYFYKYPVFKTNWKYLLPLSIFFLLPFTITFRWLLSLGSDFNPWNPSIVLTMSIKWIIVLGSLIYIYVDYKKNKLNNIVLIAGFMCVVYPTTMIATLPSLIIWILLFRKRLPKIAIWDMLIITSTIFVVMWYLNSFNNNLNFPSNIEIPSTLSMIQDYYLQDKSNLLLFIKEPVLRTIYILIGFTPLLVLIYFKRHSLKKIFFNHYTLVSLFAVIYLVSIFGVVLLDFSVNGDQIHTNIFYPLYILIFYVGLIYLLKDKNTKISASALILLVVAIGLNIYGLSSKIALTEKVETKNYNTIIDNLKNFDGESVYIVDVDYFKLATNKNFYFEMPGPNLRFDVSNHFPTLLSLDRLKINSLTDKFFGGSIYISAKYLDQVVNKDLTYQEVFNNNDKLKLIIIQNSSPEIENAEGEFSADYIGEIDGFSYYKRR
ncbi:MAG: hypothetical protein ACJA2M_001277 [Polaribacter sp.]|jgi:hypothetical protein|tara:strand:+ start:1775 stop:3685 length:1911 start_codon:yes stop_codon:yes gene_type:complete